MPDLKYLLIGNTDLLVGMVNYIYLLNIPWVLFMKVVRIPYLICYKHHSVIKKLTLPLISLATNRLEDDLSTFYSLSS